MPAIFRKNATRSSHTDPEEIALLPFSGSSSDPRHDHHACNICLPGTDIWDQSATTSPRCFCHAPTLRHRVASARRWVTSRLLTAQLKTRTQSSEGNPHGHGQAQPNGGGGGNERPPHESSARWNRSLRRGRKRAREAWTRRWRAWRDELRDSRPDWWTAGPGGGWCGSDTVVGFYARSTAVAVAMMGGTMGAGPFALGLACGR